MPNPIVLAQADPAAEARAEQIEQQVEQQIRQLEQQIQNLEQQAEQLVNEVQTAPGAPDVSFDPGPTAIAGILGGIAVPIFFFMAVAAVLWARYHYAHRARQDVQNTVRAALERGTPLTSEVLDKLIEPPAPKSSDLRRGAIWMGLGLGLGAFGFVLGDPGVVRPMLAVGLVPVLLGAAYLVLWRFNEGKKQA